VAGEAVILSMKNVSAGYGAAPVLRDVGFVQANGEILGVVGHNGMGKTTLLRTLMGLLTVASGAITFDGKRIESSPPHRRSTLGIGYVPQGDPGFPDLTVAENLTLATTIQGRAKPMTIDAVVELFPRLRELLKRQSGALSGGERQLLSIARAVIRSPRLLLLDELTEGVQPSLVEELVERLGTLHAQLGMSILIVDQELAFVAALATRVLVMQKGQFVKDLEASRLSEPDILGSFSAD
jgi:branched-chain amino acid transport system ATP-binding protein